MLEQQDVQEALSRSVERRHTGVHRVADETTGQSFPLPGVRLEPTNVDTGDGTTPVTRVVRITTGPGITDYVTHETEFAYSTYGIHVGQDDRLTFFGDDQRIAVHLIDCREDSPQLGDEITIELAVSAYRVLIIPKGVAHTLDGLGGVVTRDEPVWYADSNPDWNPDNDLVSFPRTASSAPVVQTNRHELPVSAHLLVSRMSQRTSGAVRGAYGARYRATIGGRVTYVTLRPNWRAAEVEIVPGGPVRRNNFTLTGPESFTLVPSTDSCTSDVLEVELGLGDEKFIRHERSRRHLTWLTGSREAAVELIDADGERQTVRLGDPTIAVRIPPGTWYRLTGRGRAWFRSETELLDVDPTAVQHFPGQDAELANEDGTGAARAEQDSDRYLPGASLHALARMEATAMSLT
ncbi:hypothetical protein JL475_34645 [Streptomyces sp. M2CJ-2]|uniref:hypothetical protein n=1 Tax=Streptomyces sp. M2CJ-2 TaxID=2803948 RepID=UPI0019270F1B|nr:hypothetical protein [Streptomyces sp. M2CJ-2]MBL3670995.1 hypothetical protein [Streptomyces sp. M2CJ-2]